MKVIPIAAIELDQTGRLAVRPDTPDTKLFDHIYRAATGARWRSKDGAFVPDEVKGAAPSTWYAIIVSSVRSELGIELRITPATEWIKVPADDRREIESRAK